MSKSPINWYSGKYYMTDKIIKLFLEHRVYVELFGGTAHVPFKCIQEVMPNDPHK